MNNKKIRLIELFSGYGSQALALKYLGVDFESWRTCEWAVKSIQAYKDIHFKDDNTDYSKDLNKEQLVEFLYNKGISSNYNEPMNKQQIKRLGEDKLRTIYNNIKATHNMVNIQQVKGGDLGITEQDKFEYWMFYSYPCITEDSLILTKDGYKEYKDLQVGDYVLTKSNTWQKIAKKFDNGVHKTYYLQGMGFENIHCTLNHKFYVREKYRKGHKGIRCFKEPEFKEVKDITRNHYFGVPVIQEEIPFYRDDLDFWYMIGYYLGDGWLSHKDNTIMLACSETKLQKLKSHLDVNKWHYTYNWNETCYRLRFANKEIHDFISKYIGMGCFEKRICGEILRLPKAQLNSLLDGYIDSDGCRIKKNIQFSSVNRELIYGISSIINKVYHRATCISKNVVSPTKIIEGRTVNQHDWYLLRFKPMNDVQDKAFYEDGYIWYPFTKIIEDKEEHVYNMEIENDHSYIVQGCISKNCQDLSLAGLGKGMSKGSGTRSGLLWEVERILDECKELGTLPQVLCMENVPQVHGKKNIADFNMWIDKLNSLGYTSNWADLNAKNYGVPQNRNRTFMISRLDTTKQFEFPKPITLVNKLKDLLEDEVDEKYYLSDTIVAKLNIGNEVKERIGVDLNDKKSKLRDITSTIKARYDCGYEHFTPGPTGVAEPTINKMCNDSSGNNFNAVYSDDGVARTLLARDYKDPMRVATELKQVAQMYPNSGNPQAGRIYDKGGLSPCLDTCQGGNREVKIVEESCSELQKEVCNRAVNYMQEGDVIDYTYSNSRLEEMNNGFIKTKNSEDNTIMNTLTTNSEAFGVCVKEPRICASRGRNPENPNSREKGEHLEQRIELGPEGLSNTLTTVQKDNYLVEPRIIEVNKNAKHQQDLVQHQEGIARCLCCGTHGSAPHLTKTLVETEPRCIEHNITTIVKVRKYPVDTQALCELLRKRKSQLKYNNDYIAEQLSVPKTNVEHWFRNDEHFSIPTSDIWFKLKELLQIDTDKFDESIMTFEEKESEFDMSNRAYEDNGISPTLTTQCNSNIVETQDNLKRQLCNKLIENGMVEEDDAIRHSYTNNRLSNGEKNMGRIESKEKLCPTLDTRCDCLGVCVSGSDRFDSNMFSSTEKKLFTKDGNIKRYINSDVVDEFKEGQMATTSFPNGYGHGPRTHDESIALNTIDKPCVKNNLRIRKLTPNECFRLQGVNDYDFKNCAVNQSNASLYHLAGDSICVSVLMAIFGTLLNIDWKQKAVKCGIIKVNDDDTERNQPKLERFNWDI